jgi:DNA-directed RNA polymerase subunit N (RpoN/RPB10)
MIIPIKCFTCGFVIADKYRYYKTYVCEKKLKNPDDIKSVLYLTKEFRDKTIEGMVLDEIGIKRMCCRRHFLTHVDIE